MLEITEGGQILKNIIACLDGSPLAEQVLPFTVEEAKTGDARITFFRAVAEPASCTSIPLTSPKNDKAS